MKWMSILMGWERRRYQRERMSSFEAVNVTLATKSGLPAMSDQDRAKPQLLRHVKPWLFVAVAPNTPNKLMGSMLRNFIP
ncbi:hypothetical protein TNCT_531851 [Trichonephila clavata]|uniref:Uncharacterized protein n=1 Tax=Trichonephila clavata TaxID=2740835 RepID=A0A8X6FVC7_TRICU|nr:hypothetical protein TNCT_531851 [Trichonephila clavata]